MKPTRTTLTPAPCVYHRGHPTDYQADATDAVRGVRRDVPPWAWITNTCGTDTCLEPDHLVVNAPTSLAYPAGVCVYCGRPARTKDHLLPRHWSGQTDRHFVAVVPSCGACNNHLSDTLTRSITERRALAHARIRRKYAKVLKAPDRTPEEMAEYGPNLRSFIEHEADRKAEITAMLTWPTDPTYDLRALERAGIHNPYETGLLLPPGTDLSEYVKDVA